MDLGIVTCCRNYGRYLDDWATSLIAMTRRPSMVGIVDAGSTDDSPRLIERAAAKLEAAGFRVLTRRIETQNIGRGRNAAVELADTEWVQHFDCDDQAMPHMIEEFERYADEADVIAAGYERSGNLAAGPRARRRVYSNTQGEQTRKSKAPASGVSPFRKALWEQRPYREDMPGGWDTALWLGFSHLDPPARFVATKRPVFYYRQHGDSIFNTRRVSRRRTVIVGRKLHSIRSGHQGVSVIVPWRPDNGPRDRAWDWIRRRYAALHPWFEVVVGTCPDAHWRKGVAVARAIEQASGWTLVIADADCFVSAKALRDSVAIVETNPEVSWVIPHGKVNRLDEAATAEVMAGPFGRRDFTGLGLQRAAYEGYPGGGMLVIERSKYEASGGIPSVFKGWGAEDEALSVILDTLVPGQRVRLGHDLIHLYHPQLRRLSHDRYQTNRRLYRAIAELEGEPDELWDLLEGWREGRTDGRPRRLDNRVSLVALRSFEIGTRQLQRGATFKATIEHARRLLAMSDPPVAPTRGGKLQMAAIERDERARRTDYRARRLALAGRKTRERANRAPETVDPGAAPNLTRSDYA